MLAASAALLCYDYRSYRRPGEQEEDLDDLDDLEELSGEDPGQEADDNAVPAR